MRRTPLIWVILGLYVAAAIPTFFAYRFQMNPDGVSYLSIAHDYLRGDFHLAINAYWSPLYSLLLVPFLAVGIPPLIAAKLLAVFVGMGTLAGSWMLARNLGLSECSRAAIGVALIPVVLFFGMSDTTPDLLATTLVVFYLAHLTNPNYLDLRFSGFWTGILGAAAYLAKAYLFWFFLGHLLIVCIVWMRGMDFPKRYVARRMATALLAFALFAGIWISHLHDKYGRFTTGSSGSYNHALDGPDSPGHPMYTQGFLPPPNAAAVSAWEDPTYFKMPKWNPLGSTRNFEHQLRLIDNNFRATLRILAGYSIFAVAILLAAGFVAGSFPDPKPQHPYLLVFLAVLLYPCGYLFMHVEERFLSSMAVLLLILGVALPGAPGLEKMGGIKKLVVIVLVCVSFAVGPIQFLWRNRGMGRSIYAAAGELSSVLPKGEAIASDSDWPDTLYLAFDLKLKYFGLPKPGESAEEILADLRANKIDYFLVWGDPGKYPFVLNYPEISNGRVNGLRVYHLTPTPGS